jgi:LacI family transcriptional regulator
MKSTPVSRNVLVVLWLAGSAGRKQLSGVLRYISEGHPWTLRIVSDPRDMTEHLVRQCQNESYNGFIGHASVEAAHILGRWEVPTVLIDYPPPALAKITRPYALILDEDEKIGALAATYFRTLGKFAIFAFIPDTENRAWSRLRERGFRAALHHVGEHALSYTTKAGLLSEWLKHLPKPAAILASHDFRAIDVLNACREAHIPVPNDICVLGVDNDEIVCDYATPTLSSIRIDHERIGYLAAAELDKRMKNRKSRQTVEKMRIPPINIVERGSTRFILPITTLVARMNRFIDTHATEPIGVKDVVANVGVSRSLADLRFRQIMGFGIRKAIENRRLELIRSQLRTTSRPIAQISRLSGYLNVQRLKYVFKARFGMSMREYRKTHTLHTPSK